MDLDDFINMHGCSEGACSFITGMMSASPEERPTAAEAYLDPWVDECRSHDGGLTRSMLRSLEGYAAAPRLVKVCLLLIAARMEGEDLKPFRHAFDRLDTDGTGELTLLELEVALEKTASAWCWEKHVDVASIFIAADLNKDDVLEYTEFIAACLHSDLKTRTGKELITMAFQALDMDSDGLVSVEEVHQFFHCEKHLPLLESLPDRAFTKQEFYTCLSGENGGVPKNQSPAPCTSWSFCACRGEGDSGDEFASTEAMPVEDPVHFPDSEAEEDELRLV